ALMRLVQNLRRCESWTCLVFAFALSRAGQAADVELIARGALAGNAVDQSGLQESLANEIPHARLGGFSALEYSGSDDWYIALSDRGPQDGAFPYRCRFHA